MLSRLESLQWEGRLIAAEASFRRILKQAPAQVYAWLGLGYCASLQGAMEEAQRAVDTAVSVLTGDTDAVIACSQALIHLGHVEAAQGLLLEHGDTAAVRIALGDLEERLGRVAAAIEQYKAARELDHEKDQPLRKLIQLQRRMGHTVAALATVDGFESQFPQHRAAAWHYRGQIYSSACDPARAISAFQDALAINPSFESCRMDLAREWRQLRKFDEAGAVLAAQPPTYALCLAQSDLALHCRDHVSARQYAEAARTQEPGRVDSWARLMRIELDRGDHAAAHAAVDGMEACGPQHRITALRHRLDVVRAEGDEHRALEIVRQMVERQPADPGIRLELARQYRRMGNRSASWDALRAVLRRDPNHVGALSEIGDQARQQQDFATALTCFEKIAALEPMQIGHLLRLADLLDDLGQSERAAEMLRDIASRFGASAEFKRHNIRRLKDAGALPQALTAARDAFTLFPDQMGCWLDLFDLSFKQATLAETAALVERAPARNTGEDVAVLQARARLLACANDRAGAILCLRSALALQPNNRGLFHQLFEHHVRRGDFQSAEDAHVQAAVLDGPSRRMLGATANASQSNIGQIVNECRLDPEAMRQLQQVFAESDDVAIASLMTMMRQRPHHIPTAFTLLSRLHQAGYFQAPERPLSRRSAVPSIPKRIFQFWDDPSPPSDLADLSRSWRDINPDYQHVVLNEATALRYLDTSFQPPVAEAFRRCRDATTQADLLRLAVLCREGGVWADMDDRCLRSLGEILPPYSAAIFWQEGYGTICNNFMAACPDHPVLRWALSAAVTAINRGDRDKVWMLTGPGLLTRALANILVNAGDHWRSWLETVTILSERDIWPSIAIHCHASHKRLGRHWLKQSFASGKGLSIGDYLHAEPQHLVTV